jgi:hypothetical protein
LLKVGAVLGENWKFKAATLKKIFFHQWLPSSNRKKFKNPQSHRGALRAAPKNDLDEFLDVMVNNW